MKPTAHTYQVAPSPQKEILVFFNPHNFLKWILGPVHSQNLAWQRNIRCFNRRRIFKWWIFHCHVSLQGGYPFKNLNKICEDVPSKKINLLDGFNPFEKYARQNGFIFPNFRGEIKKDVETTTYLEPKWPLVLIGTDLVLEGCFAPK